MRILQLSVEDKDYFEWRLVGSVTGGLHIY